MNERLLILEAVRGQRSLADAAAAAGISEDEAQLWRDRYLCSKLPPASATFAAGTGSAVRVVRDGTWTPHVYAGVARDLFFGLGFAMAQDRLWQMDYLRRRALGRLAEVMGATAVASDRRHRILQIGGLADRELGRLGAEAAEALEGFSAGVNGWIEQARGNLPLEFELLEYGPEPWSPRDTLALMRAFYWQLTGRLENIAAGEAASRWLTPELAADFLRTEHPDETILPASGGTGGAVGGGDSSGGSNNWAVAPARSASGRALLATDPHLPFSLPVGLYQAHLAGAGYNVIGTTYPGAPMIWFGHNERIAWGITNLVASPRDVYVETINPENPAEYREGDRWVRFHFRNETIAVRDGSAVELTVRATSRGPLVDELLPLPAAEPSQALSLRWVGQDPLGDVQAVLDVNRAGDWDSFRAALAGWRLPIFNLVYADADGHIGWQAAGAIPIRGSGDATRGYRPANDPEHRWTGFVPTDRLPSVQDPERGWIATANNRPAGDSHPSNLYGWWAPGGRAVRLRELLSEGQGLSNADSRRMQFDSYSPRAADGASGLARLLAGRTEPHARRMLELFDGWDFHYTPDSRAALAFDTFYELWLERVIGARFPAEAQPFLIALAAGAGLALRLLADGRPIGWFADASIAEHAVATTVGALRELDNRFGADATRWRWGDAHTVSFLHPLHGEMEACGLFSTAPAEAHGTHHVLNNNGYAHGSAAGRFAVGGGAEYRMVVDFGDLDAAESVLTTGQSGQPGSPHYTDQTEDWRLGRYRPMPFSEHAVAASSVGETRLGPSR
ncbi:MAG: penicillin acylase family protein [Chloroflexota bacterium]